MWISNYNIIVRNPRIFCVDQHNTDISNYFRSKNIKILLEIIHHNFSKFDGLRTLSNYYITIEKPFLSRSDGNHLQNWSCVQQEEQENFFLLTVREAENSKSLVVVVLLSFTKCLLPLNLAMIINYLSIFLSEWKKHAWKKTFYMIKKKIMQMKNEAKRLWQQMVLENDFR
jgi:hypothetical protein